jgi:hypothetical protein
MFRLRDEYGFLQRKASDNIHGQKGDDWWKQVVDRAAEVLMAEPFNLKVGEVAPKLLHDFPISESRLYRVLDDKYKDPYYVTMRKKEEERINKPSKESLQISTTKEGTVEVTSTKVLTTPTSLASEVFQKEKTEKKDKELKRKREQYGKKQHTKAEVRFRELLDKRQIPYRAQVSFTRTGETTKEGLPKVYIADFVVNNLIFELEDPGTSCDSIERNLFFKKEQLPPSSYPQRRSIFKYLVKTAIQEKV